MLRSDIIRIKFVDFWPNFDPQKNYFVDLLNEICAVEHSSAPDLLFFGSYGSEHTRYRCHKIFFASENTRPSFHACDYAIGFDYLNHPRYLRLPLYLLYGDPQKLVGKSLPSLRSENKRFCCFVVSNAKAKERNEFFTKLNARRQVDSGGKFLNNVGGPVENKREFIRGHRFTIAFENSCYPGYTTEKIFEPMLEGSIPIYWGNPRISEEFNANSFINVHDYPNFDEAIETILAIDADRDRYAQILREPWFKNDKVPDEISRPFLVNWFRGVLASFRATKPISATPMWYWNYVENKMAHISYWFSVWTGTANHFR